MSTRLVPALASVVRLGHARVDVTPPTGIYHRMWGAASHDRATGVHRPLVADVLALRPLGEPGPQLIVAHVDLVGLVQRQHDALVAAVATTSGLPTESIVIAYSHSHAAGWFAPDRVPLPGGELIAPYLATLADKLAAASRQALAALQDVTITYASGRCAMAANRDYWDDTFGGYTCGFNPDAPADDTLIVARATDAHGGTVATLVNYACHPTTLAWQNTLLSPDYPGALRETVERATGAPCIFAQGACGDLGPRRGYTGDVEVADQNGRQVGYAAVAALASMGPPATDQRYTGPVVSGATLGTWADAPFEADRAAAAARFAGGSYTVALPLKPLPDAAALDAELADWQNKAKQAAGGADASAARDYTARAERARRWLERLRSLPEGTTYPMRCSTHLLGDAFWVTTGGEPYSALQVDLRRRFPEHAVLVSPLAGDMQVAYLLAAGRYGKGLYQEEPSILAPGCLETLADAIATRMARLLDA